jgi:hypothetical protein
MLINAVLQPHQSSLFDRPIQSDDELTNTIDTLHLLSSTMIEAIKRDQREEAASLARIPTNIRGLIPRLLAVLVTLFKKKVLQKNKSKNDDGDNDNDDGDEENKRESMEEWISQILTSIAQIIEKQPLYVHILIYAPLFFF